MTSAVSTISSATGSLIVEGLTQAYGAHLAVNNVSWQAPAGSVLCLLGHSGCGKTTMLRLIAGLETPSQGRIVLDGQEISGPNTFVAPEKRHIGLVFQDYALFPHLDVLSNVMFGLPNRSAKSREIAMAALTRVGMAHHAKHFPHTLSGGEQQRVALARALAPSPRVVLMDEPFSNLDRRLRDQVREDTMRLLREAGATAVVVTHDPEEALRIADHIVLMHAGKVEQQGSAETLYREPSCLFSARYFSDLNEVPGRFANGVLSTAIGTFKPHPASPHINDGQAFVYIRPQDIQLADESSADTVNAVVQKRVFLGFGEELVVAINGVAQAMVMQVPYSTGKNVGESISLLLPKDRALVFAATA